MNPTDRKYTETHEWVKIEGDSATIGISDHAQDSLGDVTFVELPESGSRVTKGKECGVIESVKAASDLYAPVSGTVAEVNGELETAPEAINQSPWEKGWLFKVNGVDASELDSLMDAEAYEKFLESNA